MKYDTDWQEQAACRDWNYALFFWDDGSRDEDPQATRRAKAICNTCPVRRQCLEFALRNEKAGSLPFGHAQFMYWWDRKCNEHGCTKKMCIEHMVRKAFPTFKWKEFRASSTPPQGVYGGFTATERHTKGIKHLETLPNKYGRTVCIQGYHCDGCRPVDEWVDMLFEKEEV